MNVNVKSKWGRLAVLAAVVVSTGVAAPASAHDAGGTWTATGSMLVAREGGGAGLGAVATTLQDGRVLVAGGYNAFDGVFDLDARYYLAESELYDPASGTWSATGSMRQTRYGHALVTLDNGYVLAAGGTSGSNAPITATAELYNPRSRHWRSTKSMSACRVSPSFSLLASGKVLLTGGIGCLGNSQATAEVFDPSKGGGWTTVASMHHPRWGHTAVTLDDGRILVMGGRESPVGAPTETVSTSAEIYDPATDTWTETGSMNEPRFLYSAGLLPSGDVIVAGGHCPGGHVSPPMPTACTSSTAEIFDVSTGMWSYTGSMSVPRVEGASQVLANGMFLMAGGGMSPTAEIYDPASGTWSPTGSMSRIRDDSQLVTLTTGDLLIVGGFEAGPGGYFTTATTELFHPPA